MSDEQRRRFAHRDVSAILERAAELQRAGRGDGLSLEELEQAARESGIDPSHVRRAVRELDTERALPDSSAWAGAPLVLRVEREMQGGLAEDAAEAFALQVGRSLGMPGQVARVGRSLTWTASGHDRNLEVRAVAAGDVVTIEAHESLRQLAGSLFGGICGGLGGGGLGAAMGIGLGAFHSPLVALILAAGFLGGSYVLARAIFQRTAGGRFHELRGVVDDLERTLLARAPPPAELAEPEPAPSRETSPRGTGRQRLSG